MNAWLFLKHISRDAVSLQDSVTRLFFILFFHNWYWSIIANSLDFRKIFACHWHSKVKFRSVIDTGESSSAVSLIPGSQAQRYHCRRGVRLGSVIESSEKIYCIEWSNSFFLPCEETFLQKYLRCFFSYDYRSVGTKIHVLNFCVCKASRFWLRSVIDTAESKTAV